MAPEWEKQRDQVEQLVEWLTPKLARPQSRLAQTQQKHI